MIVAPAHVAFGGLFDDVIDNSARLFGPFQCAVLPVPFVYFVQLCPVVDVRLVGICCTDNARYFIR